LHGQTGKDQKNIDLEISKVSKFANEYTVCYTCVPAAKDTFSVSEGDIRTAL